MGQTHNGSTPVFIAAQNGHASTTIQLIQARCNVDILSQEESGVAPLFIVAQNGHALVVNHLIEAHVTLIFRQRKRPTRCLRIGERLCTSLPKMDMRPSRKSSSQLDVTSIFTKKRMGAPRFTLRLKMVILPSRHATPRQSGARHVKVGPGTRQVKVSRLWVQGRDTSRCCHLTGARLTKSLPPTRVQALSAAICRQVSHYTDSARSYSVD